MKKGSLKGYLFRFSVIHLIVYFFIAFVFRNYLNYNEEFTSSMIYNNFRDLDSFMMRYAPLFQLIRGIFLGLITYPVYNSIIGAKNGWLKLFGLLWGLSLVGSVAATPGSIEGFIYTKTPLIEHLIALPEVTLQVLLFSLIFVKWENVNYKKMINRRQKVETAEEDE